MVFTSYFIDVDSFYLLLNWFSTLVSDDRKYVCSRRLFAPVPCNASINEELRVSFLPSSRRNPFALLTDSCFIKMADKPVPPLRIVTQAPALLQTAQSPVQCGCSHVFRWRYTPSLFSALPLAPVRFFHVNLLLFYTVAVLFVLCLAICGLCRCSSLGPP